MSTTMNEEKAKHAEQAVIGSLLTDKDVFDDIAGELKPDDFKEHLCQRVYVCVRAMKSADPTCVVDILTVASQMRNLSGESEAELFRDIAELANSVFSSKNVKAYTEIVKKESNRRKTAELLRLSTVKVANAEENYLEFVKQGLTDIENDIPFLIRPYRDILDRVIAKLEEDCALGKKLSGLETGFSALDYILSGLQKGNLIILGARPSMGKTVLMMNIADHIGINLQLPVAVFSLEMPEEAIVNRTLSRLTGLPGDDIFGSKLKPEHFKDMLPALEKMTTSKVFIHDASRASVYQMRSICRKIRNEHGLAAVFIDYIELVQAEGETEQERLGNISRDLKSLAKDFDVPVFVLCQLNRNLEKRTDHTPILSDIRQSGNIEQDADVVMFLHRDKKIPHEAKLTIAKNRNGRTGEVILSCKLENFEFRNQWA